MITSQDEAREIKRLAAAWVEAQYEYNRLLEMSTSAYEIGLAEKAAVEAEQQFVSYVDRISGSTENRVHRTFAVEGGDVG